MTREKEQTRKPTGRALERRVRRYIDEHDLLHSGDRLLAAVSGGADSTALLLLMSRLQAALGIELKAAYFDHRLRGDRASRREKEFVAKLAARLGVELITGSGDVRVHARKMRLSLEEAARELRYRFLADAALQAGAVAVATGHTADDQTETVLMNILRGTGLGGLAGMLPRAPWPYPDGRTAQLRLVRPLLEVTREETLACCDEAGVRPLEDVSNRSLAYRRNRIRQQVLPFLRRYNPGIDKALRRLAGSAAAEREALEQIAAASLPGIAQIEERAVRISRAGLRALPRGLRVPILRAAAARLLGDVQDIGWAHWEAMAASLQKPTGAELDLPRRLRLRIEYDSLILALRPQEPPPAPLPAEETALTVPGRTQVDGWTFDARLAEGRPPSPAAPSADTARFDLDALALPLAVRRRRPGDRFRLLGLPAGRHGMSGEKKLQDLFVDAKVPRAERDRVPIVCDRAGIVWVVGHRIAERAKVTGSTLRTLELTGTARSGDIDAQIGVDP